MTSASGVTTLALLVVEAIAISLAVSLTDSDGAFRYTMGILALVILMYFVLALVRPELIGTKRGERVPQHPGGRSGHDLTAVTEEPEIKYDIFISSPMSSLESIGYEKFRKDILRVMEAIETHCRLRCYYSGKHRPTLEDFEATDVGLRNDMEAVRASRRFLMIFPESIVSSALVEAGMALALGKPAIYFTGRNVSLPFMLEGAANSTSRRLPPTRQYRFSDIEQLIRQIKNNGRDIFE
ncbi:hypothetical protein ACN27J_24330 [Solwaraspora sp. WMMB762]|uniref:hypothetical protein n=1 Tax=Solwaraspora sp. WMMB762 TaxID=3404120 RepID=UPI003B92D1E4